MSIWIIIGSVIIMLICVHGGFQWGYEKGRQHEKILQEALNNLRNIR